MTVTSPELRLATMEESFTPEQVAAHIEMLEEKVFQVSTKWPQFRRLLTDCKNFANETSHSAVVVALERSLLYGNLSLLAPIFYRQKFISVDCSPASAEQRGAYNRNMVDDPRCIQVPTTQRGKPEDTGLETASADLVIVPNLVHHVANQPGLFHEISRILKPGGRGYIFEPLIREIHQDPDDYLRYTPAGFRKMIESAGMIYDQTIPEGGPFTAVAYCWSQALEYIPEPERSRMEKWFYGQHFQDLLRWDVLYPRNLKRKHTSFPTAFGIYFRKAN